VLASLVVIAADVQHKAGPSIFLHLATLTTVGFSSVFSSNGAFGSSASGGAIYASYASSGVASTLHLYSAVVVPYTGTVGPLAQWQTIVSSGGTVVQPTTAPTAVTKSPTQPPTTVRLDL
jgi:predicted outer membrane repeat protein